MSAALAGLRSRPTNCVGPATYTFADDGYRLSGPDDRDMLAHDGLDLCTADVCSMFARMPRYAPAVSGIRARRGFGRPDKMTAPGTVLVLFDSSSRRISEQSSGLLIRGFGVQVPGGAPVLTWGFTTPGHFFASVLSPWLLRGRSRARTQQFGACQKRPDWRPIRAACGPDVGPLYPVVSAPTHLTNGLDLQAGRRSALGLPILMSSRSVKTADDIASDCHANCAGHGPAAEARLCPCGDSGCSGCHDGQRATPLGATSPLGALASALCPECPGWACGSPVPAACHLLKEVRREYSDVPAPTHVRGSCPSMVGCPRACWRWLRASGA